MKELWAEMMSPEKMEPMSDAGYDGYKMAKAALVLAAAIQETPEWELSPDVKQAVSDVCDIAREILGK